MMISIFPYFPVQSYCIKSKVQNISKYMCKENSKKHAHTSTSGWDAENHNNWGNYRSPMVWWWILKGRWWMGWGKWQ